MHKNKTTAELLAEADAVSKLIADDIIATAEETAELNELLERGQQEYEDALRCAPIIEAERAAQRKIEKQQELFKQEERARLLQSERGGLWGTASRPPKELPS